MDRILPYFAFRGRTNRQRYWLTVLAIYGLTLAGMMVGYMVPFIGLVVAPLVMLAGMWAGLAVAARRLHDRNKSAWWLLVMYAPMILLTAMSRIASASSPEAGFGFALFSLPFVIWVLVELGLLKGTAGPNRFGPDPLQPSPQVAFS
jgi:uncharacterized membrane protein YhaH (DUF805 family)